MMPVTKAKAQKIVNWFSRELGSAIKQGDVDRAFGGHVSRRNRLEVTHTPLHVVERKPRRINSLAKRFDGIDCLVIPHDGRCLTPADGSVRAGDLHHHDLKNICA